MQNENQNNTDNGVIDLLVHDRFDLGDVVEIKQDLFEHTQQCRVVAIMKEDNTFYATVVMLTRPWLKGVTDFVSRNEKIYEYWETNEIYTINADLVLNVVPSCIYNHKKPNLQTLRDQKGFTIDELKSGCIYITRFFDGVGRVYPPVESEFTCNWYHFDLAYINVKEHDALNDTWFMLKKIVFNPFVSAVTKCRTYKSIRPGGTTRRPRSIEVEEPNMDLWEFMVLNRDLADEINPYAALKARLVSTGRTNLLHTNIMIYMAHSINFIFGKIKEFVAALLVNLSDDDAEYQKIRKNETQVVDSDDEEVEKNGEEAENNEQEDVVDLTANANTGTRRAYATEIWSLLKNFDKLATELKETMDKMGVEKITVMDDGPSVASDSDDEKDKPKKKKRQKVNPLIEEEAACDDAEDEDDDSDDVGSLADFIEEDVEIDLATGKVIKKDEYGEIDEDDEEEEVREEEEEEPPRPKGIIVLDDDAELADKKAKSDFLRATEEEEMQTEPVADNVDLEEENETKPAETNDGSEEEEEVGEEVDGSKVEVLDSEDSSTSDDDSDDSDEKFEGETDSEDELKEFDDI